MFHGFQLNKLVIQIATLLFAVTIHEVAHGWVAWRLGDPTAKRAGRLTLNPIKHLDLMGSFILPL
ncbi:MAG: site-2 protease family protein, partial [Deltaproteobacteria bacterium]|nr:site-2 protease family protein [Deltaproteobacteria bacterium]